MNKKDLERIKSPYSREQILEAARIREPAGKFYGSGPWFASARISSLSGVSILVFDIHSLVDLQKEDPPYIVGMRMFIEAKGFITRVYTERYKSQWITSRLDTVTSWNSSFKGYVDTASMDAIRNFYGDLKAKEPINLIIDTQRKIGADKLAAKHKRITARIDAEMSLVPSIPASFGKWVDELALYESRYIYYRYQKTKKPLRGYCTHCRKDVSVVGAKHNASGNCPNCKSPITFKSIGKAGRIVDRGFAYLIQKTADSRIVLRIFRVRKDYGHPEGLDIIPNYRKALAGYSETVRGLLGADDKDFTWYEWAAFKSTGKQRWCDDCGKQNFDCGALYSRNLFHALKGTTWQYSRLHDVANQEPGFKMDVIRLLRVSREQPCFEYLVRFGFKRLVAEMLDSYSGYERKIVKEAKKLNEALGVKKEQMMMLREMNAGWKDVETLQRLNGAGIAVTHEELRFFAEMGLREEMIRYLRHTTPYKFMKYAKTVCIERGNGEPVIPCFANDWLDYMRACSLLMLDIESEFVMFPQTFTAAHDARTKEAEEVKRKGLDKAAKKHLSEFAGTVAAAMKKQPKHFSEYVLICPKSGKEIRDEGAALHHCVGGYVDRVASGETMILFVRSAADLKKPLFTVEFRNGKVVQCRGYGNSVRDPVPQIIMDFARWFEEAYRAMQSGTSKGAKTSCA